MASEAQKAEREKQAQVNEARRAEAARAMMSQAQKAELQAEEQANSEAAEAAYLSTRYDEMDRLGGILLKNARTVIDRVPFHVTKINALTGQAKFTEALATGLPFPFLGMILMTPPMAASP